MNCKSCFIITLILASIAFFCGMKKGQELKEEINISTTVLKTVVVPIKPIGPTVEVDIDAMIQIESSGKTNEVSPAGARGLCQIMEPTWNDCNELMKTDWNYWECWNDPEKNKAVGTFYVNTKIPQMIKRWKIPDSDLMRLACYNWGPGNMRKLYEKYEYSWRDDLPRETFNHLIRYEKQINRKSDYIEER